MSLPLNRQEHPTDAALLLNGRNACRNLDDH